MKISYYGKNVLERLSLLVERVQDFYKDRLYAIVVFGSLAKGEFSAYSDIDLLIILSESSLSFRKRIEEFYQGISMEFEGHFLSPIILTVRELNNFNPLYLALQEGYISFYDKEGIIAKIMVKVKEKMSKGDIIKKEGYWRIVDESFSLS